MRKFQIRPTLGRQNTGSRTMPLRRIKKFCTATCRATSAPCKNPAAFGMPVCRFHGAHKPETVRRGSDHGRFKTGQFTQATKATYRESAIQLMDLETIGFRVGMITGRRTPGRKPG